MSHRNIVGELRPTQLLHTFGVGAIIDLPSISAIVMGLDEWDTTNASKVIEDRLLANVRKDLGTQVEALLSPPIARDDTAPWQEPPLIGVPVTPFPGFMRCPACDRLGPRTPGIIELKTHPFRPDRANYVHKNCQKLNSPTVLPARFIVACSNGHLDDFPWVSFVHEGSLSCKGDLVLYEFGASGEAADIEVRCKVCDASRRMVDAFKGSSLPGYKCRGRHPHLRSFEEGTCVAPLKTILLGASNSWFPVSRSALYVPPTNLSKIAEHVANQWATLADATSPIILQFLRKQGQLGPLANFSDDQIFGAIEAKRNAVDESGEDLKAAEWRVFADPAHAPRMMDFWLTPVETPKSLQPYIEQVVLAERIREVTALIGFTRISDPRDLDDYQGAESAVAPLSKSPPKFVPASEVRGEGIFLRFREEVIRTWVAKHAALATQFEDANVRWRKARKLVPENVDVGGIRLVLLHSFSHALMRRIAISCGYAAASIRERLYVGDDDDKPMAGVLLYTAAPDSEGTLGGLVRLGRPDAFERLVADAIDDQMICSSDPLCAEHAPGGHAQVTLHGAACHACLFAAETSCEHGNRFLDRRVLVSTMSNAGFQFFPGK